MSNTAIYSANGKFLITSEYVVLDHVPALAIPLQLQQHMKVVDRSDGVITWTSFDYNGQVWFTSTFMASDLLQDDRHDALDPVASKLFHILKFALGLNTNAFSNIKSGCDVTTTLDFNRLYGMGTSSTLVSLVAQWLSCNPYALQFECFGGSGYDIACATASQPIVYSYHELLPQVTTVDFSPAFKEDLFFVYLNQKQNSRDAIARFDKTMITPTLRDELISMPQQFINTSCDKGRFQQLMQRHEIIIGALIDIEPVQSRLFPDFNGAIKSLGGWGGDFILVAGDCNSRQYFVDKGYPVLMNWDEVVL